MAKRHAAIHAAGTLLFGIAIAWQKHYFAIILYPLANRPVFRGLFLNL
jgi:hypothetical protein